MRLGILSHHYRHDWEWDEGLMPRAATRLQAWLAAGEGDAALGEVRAALDDDLNCPDALAAIDRAAAAGQGVSQAADLLGLRI